MPKMILKIKNSLSDKSVDSEHYIALIYLYIPNILAICLTLLGIQTFGLAQYHFLFLFLFIISIFLIINALLTKYLGKKLWSYLKQKRFMVSIVLFTSLLLYIIQTFAWISFLFGSIYNILSVKLNVNSDFIPFDTTEALHLLITDIYSSSKDIVMSYSFIITLSLLLNSILPSSLSKVNIPFRKKILRIILKLLSVVIMGFMGYIFNNSGVKHLTLISAIYGAVILFASPDKILSLIDSKELVQKEDISDAIRKNFFNFKVFFTYVYLSWVISITLSGSNVPKKSLIFISSLFTFLTLTIFFQIYARNKKKDYFENWKKRKTKK